MTRRLLLGALSVAIGTFMASTASWAAENGVFQDRFVFGQSAAFRGPAAALGTGMLQGIAAAFKEANDAGGINGRKLEVVGYDDG